jgi:hypothetical protein
MIDMRTGDVWGFPTLVQSPYPVSANAGNTKPPKSEPIYLGAICIGGCEAVATWDSAYLVMQFVAKSRRFSLKENGYFFAPDNGTTIRFMKK